MSSYAPLADDKDAIITEEPRSTQLIDIQPAGSGKKWDHGICQSGCACCKCNNQSCEAAEWLGESKCVPYCYTCYGLVIMRTKTRMILGIRGSIFGDICCTCYCTPCVAYQMHHELHKLHINKNEQIKKEIEHAQTCLCE